MGITCNNNNSNWNLALLTAVILLLIFYYNYKFMFHSDHINLFSSIGASDISSNIFNN